MGWVLTLAAMARRKEAENRRKAKVQQRAKKTVKKPKDTLELALFLTRELKSILHQQERERRGW